MVNSCVLLRNTKITARIEQLRTERSKRLEITADKVLRRLEARASVTPRDFYNSDGSFIQIHELDPDIGIAIKSIEVVELYAGRGDQKTAIGLVRKITVHDGKAADELLGKNLGLWKEVGSKDNPIHVSRIELVPLV
jgi:phage terminase small subunit